MSKKRVCHNRSLRGEKLEAAIWADVSALLAEPKRLEQEYERRLNIGSESKDAPSQRKLQMQMSRVQRQISKLIDAYSEGLIEKKEFEPRIRDARAHLEKLQSEVRSQEQLQGQLSEMRHVIGQLEAFAEQVRGKLETADWTLQRQLISTLVKRVEIGEEEVRVVYRVDCGPFELAPSGGHVQDCWRRRGATRAADRVTVWSGQGCFCNSVPPFNVAIQRFLAFWELGQRHKPIPRSDAGGKVGSSIRAFRTDTNRKRYHRSFRRQATARSPAHI